MIFLTALDNYNIFYEVAKCQNITKASEKLFISQPAVSQAIKKMEENLGVTLFVRGKKGIELTSCGKKIFESVENALRNFSTAEQLIDEEKGVARGEITIGAGSNIARKILCKPVARFMKDYPLIKVNFIENVQTKMIDKLRTGDVDFVLTQQNEEFDFNFLPLFEMQYCFVQKADCKSDKLITITEGSFTHRLFDKFIKEKGLKDNLIMSVAGYKTALEFVSLGIGTTLIPKYMVHDRLNVSDLVEVYTDYPLPKTTFGIYYNSRLLMPNGKAFLEYLV